MKLFYSAIFLLVISIISFSNVSAVVINEILPNPKSDWNGNGINETYNDEWIEFFNEGTTQNLSGWKIGDKVKNYTLNYLICPHCFLVLFGSETTLQLNNADETIYFYNNVGALIDIYSYSSSSDDLSFGRCPDGNASWRENLKPTPGTENNCTQQEEPPQQQESSIKITDSPNDAKFGEEIDLELEIYRGNTSKYAVYIYVEDEDGTDVSEKVTLHCDDKFTDYTEQVSLELDCKDEQGDYIIVAEGLNERDEEEIEIESCHDIQEENESEEEDGSEGVTIGDFTYTLTIPNTIYVGEKFQIQASIKNEAEQDQEFLLWSYIYIGSKCYSCSSETRESNAKSIIVPSASSTEVELENLVQEAGQGTYKLKIKILQQGLKTPKEFTYDINILNNKNTEPNSQQTPKSSVVLATTYAEYSKTSEQQSESFSFMEFGPYILTSIALLAAIYLIITKI